MEETLKAAIWIVRGINSSNGVVFITIRERIYDLFRFIFRTQ